MTCFSIFNLLWLQFEVLFVSLHHVRAYSFQRLIVGSCSVKTCFAAGRLRQHQVEEARRDQRSQREVQGVHGRLENRAVSRQEEEKLQTAFHLTQAITAGCPVQYSEKNRLAVHSEVV